MQYIKRFWNALYLHFFSRLSQGDSPSFPSPFSSPTSQCTKGKDSPKLCKQQEQTPTNWQWKKTTSVIKELGNKAHQQNTKNSPKGISTLHFAIRHYCNIRSGILHSLSVTYLSFPWHIHSSANCFLSWMLRDSPSPVVPFTVSTQQNTTHWLRPHLHTLVSLKTRTNIFELGRIIQMSLLCQQSIIHSPLGMSPYEGTLFYPSQKWGVGKTRCLKYPLRWI